MQSCSLAKLLFLAKDLDNSLDLVNAAIKLESKSATALGLKAMILYRRNQNDDRKAALSVAQTTLAIDPSDVEATVVLAADRFLHNDNKGALKILEREPATHDNDIGIQLFKLQILEKMNDLKQAENVLMRLIKHYPKESGFRTALVKLYLYEKRPQDAEKALRAFAAANPNDLAVEMDVVRLLRTIKGPAAAREELQARIRAGGQVSDYQIALAQLDFAQGDAHKSVSLLENLGKNSDFPETALLAKVKLAEIYFAKGKIDEANELVSQILQKDHRNPGALKVRAEIHLKQGQVDAAISDLREALNDNPRSLPLTLLLASAYERIGSIDLAEKQYVAAMRISNGNAVVGLEYVAFLNRRGNPQRAGDILAQLAKRYPDNIRVLTTLAEFRLRQRNWAGAKEIADTIRRIGNDKGLADRILAATLSGQNNYNESISILEKAYTAAPSIPRMASLVNELMRAKQFDKAEKILRTTLKSNPSNVDAYVMLGAVQLRQNALDEALKSFQAAIAHNPKDANGYNALANLYMREKKHDEALKTVRAGLQVQPDSLVLHMTLAGLLTEKGDYKAAIAEYDTLLKQHPASMEIANNLASLLSEHHTDKASSQSRVCYCCHFAEFACCPF